MAVVVSHILALVFRIRTGLVCRVGTVSRARIQVGRMGTISRALLFRDGFMFGLASCDHSWTNLQTIAICFSNFVVNIEPIS